MRTTYALVGAFLLVLLLPFGFRLGLGTLEGDTRPLTSGSALSLRVITPHNQDIRGVFEAAFSDWHRERFGSAVDLIYLSPGGTNDIIRYLEDLYGRYRDASGKLLPEADVSTGIEVVWGGGDFVFERTFKPLLKPLTLDAALLRAAFPNPDLAGVPLLDPDAVSVGPKWVGTTLSSFGIVHSPAFYDLIGLPAPRAWHDLARPELSGLLALADPTRSGSAAFIYMMVIQRAMASAEEVWFSQHPELARAPVGELEGLESYRAALAQGWKEGMRVLLRIAANARYFTDTGSRPCTDVGDGEAAAGVAIDFFARVFQEEIGRRRITYHAPRGATAITPDPVGVLYGTLGAREQLANRFVEFLLSRDGQRLWNLRPGASPYVTRSLRRMPVRRDVYQDRRDWVDDENPFEAAAGFNVRPRWTRQLGRLIPIWAAAWIDSKPSLDRAYRTILETRDVSARERLLFELSDLPVEWSDVHAAPPSSAADVELKLQAARQRLGWSERFRRHYAAVAERALGPS
jgi:iron(III) transport system substrate-binding protein